MKKQSKMILKKAGAIISLGLTLTCFCGAIYHFSYNKKLDDFDDSLLKTHNYELKNKEFQSLVKEDLALLYSNSDIAEEDLLLKNDLDKSLFIKNMATEQELFERQQLLLKSEKMNKSAPFPIAGGLAFSCFFGVSAGSLLAEKKGKEL